MSLQNKFDTCIFDLDGTLTDTLEDLKNSVNFAMSCMAFPERTTDEVRGFVGNGVPMLIKRSAPENTSEEELKRAYEFFKKHYAVHLNDNTAPYEGINEMLNALRQMNVKTAVVSNKDDDAVKNIVSGFFGDKILFAQGRKDGIPPKPSPESVFKVMKKLDCEAERTIYVGDSDVDVETAHNAGLKCIGVTWGFRDKELLVKSGADYIVDKPSEIVKIITGKNE